MLPYVAAGLVLQTHWWALQAPPVAFWTVSLSLVLGVLAFKSGSATAGAAAVGAAINASLMFSSVSLPYLPWNTALIPVVAVLLLTSLATRMGRSRKEQLGTAEARTGRTSSQVAANLGMAAIACNEVAQNWLAGTAWFLRVTPSPATLLAGGLAALAEAAADTVSSELGQVLSDQPRMLTTLRRVEPGTDGAISLGGTLLGAMAAGIVAAAGAFALHGGMLLLAVSWAGGIFGLFFDSLLGATLERRGWLNNDAVNFLSTVSAAAFALALLAVLPIRP